MFRPVLIALPHIDMQRGDGKPRNEVTGAPERVVRLNARSRPMEEHTTETVGSSVSAGSGSGGRDRECAWW